MLGLGSVVSVGEVSGVRRLEVELGKAHFALDQDDVIKQIEDNGYAVHSAKMTITLTDA